MKATDLFTIILKVFGIYLIKDVLISIPPILSNFYRFLEYSLEVGVFSLLVSLLVVGIYLGIVYLLIFKTAWIISKLRLTSNLSEEPMVMIYIALLFIRLLSSSQALWFLVFAIPQFVRHFYDWFEYMDSRKHTFGSNNYDYGPILIALSEVIVGLLFLGNQRTLVNFLESRRRASKGG
jgi:hypothetical protein